jgi:predicted nucleotidyltransferase
MSASTVSLDRPAVGSICGEHRVRSLDIFGSAATDRFDPAHGDIDLVVTFEDMETGGHADAYFDPHAALETLFACRVDLLMDRSIENPFLRRSVDATRRRLYSSS